MLKGYGKNNQINRTYAENFLHQLNKAKFANPRTEGNADLCFENPKFLIFINRSQFSWLGTSSSTV